MAEAIFVDLLQKNNTSHLFEVDSAGTSNYHIGEQPDPRTLKNAQANGVVLNHKCRQFVEQDFYDFDYIIAMDDSNMANILKIKPERELDVRIFKMRYYDPLHKNANVPDPWFGGEKGFEEVYQILKRSCLHFYDELIG